MATNNPIEKEEKDRNILCPACGSSATKVCKTNVGEQNQAFGYMATGGPSKNRFIPLDDRAALQNLRTRYYVCSDCNEEFGTQEMYVVKNARLMVRRSERKGERIERFSINKVIESINHACAGDMEDRPIWNIALYVVTVLLSNAFPPVGTHKLTKDGRNIPIFGTKQVGEAVLLSLMRSDAQSSWVRYALIFYDLSAIKSYPEMRRTLDSRWLSCIATLGKIEEEKILDRIVDIRGLSA